MSDQTSSSRLAGCFGAVWAMLKMFLVVLLGIALGVGLFTVGQYAYLGLWAPIESNSQAVQQLQESLDLERQETDELRRQQEDLAQQIEMLVSEGAGQLQSLQQAQEEQIEALREIEGRLVTLEEAADQQQAALGAQAETLDSLIGAGDTYAEELAGLYDALEGAQENIHALGAAVDSLQQAVEEPRAAVLDLQLRTLLLRAQGEALQARLNLMRNNADTAGRYLDMTAATLQQALDLAPDEQRAAIVALQERVATAQQDLTDNPFAVPEEVDILWQAIGTVIGP